jgi:hypothetical protein
MPGADVLVVQEKADGSMFIEDRWTNAFRTPNLDDCTFSGRFGSSILFHPPILRISLLQIGS